MKRRSLCTELYKKFNDTIIICQQVNDGLRSVPCAIWWMGRYYLSLASSLWWTILCGCWMLSARNEWSSEALHNIASYLHATAWGLPLVLTMGNFTFYILIHRVQMQLLLKIRSCKGC